MSKKKNQNGKKQISEKQLAANRANAQQSTGAQTAEGKETVSRNAGKHYLCSADPVAPGESREMYEDFRADLFQSWNPEDGPQEYWFNRMVAQMWRLQRVYQYENRITTSAMDLEYINNEREKLSKYEIRIEGSAMRCQRQLMLLKEALRTRRRELAEESAKAAPQTEKLPQPAYYEAAPEPENPAEPTEPPAEEAEFYTDGIGPVTPAPMPRRPLSNSPTAEKQRDVDAGNRGPDAWR